LKTKTKENKMKEYTKECRYCKQNIRMVENGGKWTANNLGNGIHDCRKKENTELDRESRIARVIQMIQGIIPELEALK